MRIKTSREKRILIIKTIIRWVLYFLIIFVSFIFMNAGSFLKPILLIPTAICIASNTGELQSAFIGALCGLLIDISCGKLFGYNAIILCISCVAVSLGYSMLLRQKLINTLIISTLLSVVQGFLDYNFYYDIWGYENSSLILKDITYPVIIMTTVSTFFIYFIMHTINKFLMPKPHLTIEEAIKNFEE